MNIDHRLDLYNNLQEFINKSTEKDSIFVVSYNTESEDTIFFAKGDMDIIGGIMIPENVPVQFKEQSDMVKSLILNTAYNILLDSKEDRDVMLKALSIV